MGEMEPGGDPETKRQIAELRAQIGRNRADIDALQERADRSEDRADDADRRADRANGRADAGEERAATEKDRIDALEARVDVDHVLIGELQAEGLLDREHAVQMEEALQSSRQIGAAIGIIMAERKVSQEAAFELLSHASQRSNRKLRLLAEEVIQAADASSLPDI